MSSLTNFIDCIAKYGNCAVVLPSIHERINYVYEVTNDPLNIFKVSVRTYDRAFWNGYEVNPEAKLEKIDEIESGYDLYLMYVIVSVLVDNTLIENSEGVLIEYDQNGESNIILADQIIESSYNALDMGNYELLYILSSDQEENLNYYIDIMDDYAIEGENTKIKNRFKKASSYEMPMKSYIEEDMACIDDVVDNARERLEHISIIVDRIKNSKENSEASYYIEQLDDYCGGEKRIEIKDKTKVKERVIN